MRSEMEQDILKVLVTEEQLKARVAELGEELYEKFQGKKPLFLGVLKGSFVFMTDLVHCRQLLWKCDVFFRPGADRPRPPAGYHRAASDHRGGYLGFRDDAGFFKGVLSDQRGGFHHHRDAAG